MSEINTDRKRWTLWNTESVFFAILYFPTQQTNEWPYNQSSLMQPRIYYFCFASFVTLQAKSQPPLSPTSLLSPAPRRLFVGENDNDWGAACLYITTRPPILRQPPSPDLVPPDRVPLKMY